MGFPNLSAIVVAAENAPAARHIGRVVPATRPLSGQIALVNATAAFIAIRNGDVGRDGGVGGWQSSDRLLRENSDWWGTIPKDTATLPLLLDVHALPTGGTLEDRLTVLRAMGRPTADGDPRPVRVSGDAPACAGLDWKIDGISFGAALWQPESPTQLRRIELTVSLSSYTPAEPVEPVKIRKTRAKNGKRRNRTIHSVQGDTLRAISVRELGTSSQWTSLRAWNKALAKIDPDAPLKPHTKILLK